MESLLQIVVVLAFVRFACRASFFRKGWSIIIFAAIVALLSFLCYPIVIEQSGNFYTTLLKDATLVGNVAVLITLEAVGGMLLSIGLLNTLFVRKDKSKLHYLKYLPEILILGGVLYAEQQVFYVFPGLDFRLTASLTAGLFSAAVGLLAYIMRWVLPEKGERYELNFLLNVFLLIIAILLNAGLSSYNTGSYESEVEWLSTFVFVGMIVLFLLIGLVLYRLK